MRDLAGQRFGKLVAIEDTGKRSRGLVVWRCRCDCGNMCEVVGSSLTKGNTRSCGCLRSVVARDVSGQRFGKLVAIEPTEKRNRNSVVWRCTCDCGRECEVPLHALSSGDRKTCGHCGTGAGSKIVRDVSGQRFGKLVAIEPTEKRRRGSVVWRCTCDCGNDCEVPLSALASGHKRSCGCLVGGPTGKSAKRDLAGQRFGRLVAVRPTEKRVAGSVVWECECDCGNTCEAPASRLTTGRRKSCGCLARGGNAGPSGGGVVGSGVVGSDVVGGDACGNRAGETFTARRPRMKDISGQRFGDLTAVRVVGRQGTHAVWECVCDCGNTTNVASGNLASGRTASCGCRAKGRDPRNLTAKRFGKLVAVEITDQVAFVGDGAGSADGFAAGGGDGNAAGGGDGNAVSGKPVSPIWRCLCDCDRVVRASARDLALGNVASCPECALPEPSPSV